MVDSQGKLPPLGKLKSVGVQQHWQIPLVLPHKYKSYTDVTNVASPNLVGSTMVFQLLKVSEPTTKFEKGRPPMTTGRFQDAMGNTVFVTFFGDGRDISNFIRAREMVFIFGRLEMFAEKFLTIASPELVQEDLVGKANPVYKGKPRVINGETLREKVRSSLDLVDEAVKNIVAYLNIQDEARFLAKLGSPYQSLRQVIIDTHVPSSVEVGEQACHTLRKLSAYYAIELGRSNVDDRLNPATAFNVTIDMIKAAVQGFPYPLTQEQKEAIWGMVKELASPRAMNTIISGDVGSGKSSVFGTLARVASQAGAKVVIMAPNTVLCNQLHGDLKKWWPDIDASLVVGTTKGLPDSQVLVGTTALIHRMKKAGVMPDLLIVDEEHRFGNKQREELQAMNTNYVGSTATCVPRTMQLVALNAYSIYRIRKIHVEKTIYTQVLNEEDKVFLFQEIKKHVAMGNQALVVYPMAEKNLYADDDDENQKVVQDKRSAEGAFELWNRVYPGRVAYVHGKMSDEEKQAAVQALKDGVCDVLVSTTVIEVGIHIPKLTIAAIINAQNYGLSQLHQMRGRLARTGGQGYFYLYVPQTDNPKTIERLSIMERVTDGFEIAEEDLRLRGFGDLAPKATKQTGGMSSLVPNYDITVDDVKAIQEIISQ